MRITHLAPFPILFVGVALAQQPQIHISALSSIPPGSPVTLEDGQDYDNFLPCAKLALRPDYQHTDNEHALTNDLQKAANPLVGVIAGHGHPGQICTSRGLDCIDPSESINADNQADWKGWAGKWPNRFSGLTVLACDTGEGVEGVTLLKLLAASTRMPVRAPTDFIWCKDGDIVLDENAKWQIVTPDQTPKSIPFEKRETPPVTPDSTVQVSVDRSMRRIPFHAAQLTSFSASGSITPAFAPLNREIAQRLLREIDFTNPLTTSWVPDAVVTARFEISFDIDGREVVKNLVVLNDRLVNDVQDRRIYYRTSSAFTELLQAQRRR
jgi:hypothetical protein